MTYKQAVTAAAIKAAKRHIWVHVVIEDMGLDEYDTATDADLEGFHAGADPLVSFGPDGSIDG